MKILGLAVRKHHAAQYDLFKTVRIARNDYRLRPIKSRPPLLLLIPIFDPKVFNP